MKYCKSCDLNILTETEHCVFCSNNLVNSEATLPKELCYASFSKSVEEMRLEVIDWLEDGLYTPNDLLINSSEHKSAVVYIPYYNYTINYDIQWEAKYSVEETENFVEHKYSDNLRSSSPVNKTRTVLRWYTKDGKEMGTAVIPIKAAKAGETAVNKLVCSKGEPIKNSDVVQPAFNSEELLSSAMDKFETSMEGVIAAKLPQHKKVNIKLDYDYFEYGTVLIMNPEYQLSYKYKDVFYNVAVDSNGNIFGEKPKNEEVKKVHNAYKWKINLFLILTMMLLALGVYSIYGSHKGFFKDSLIISIILWLVFLIFSVRTRLRYTKNLMETNKTIRERNRADHASRINDYFR